MSTSASPLILLGPARSGTSLLYRTLSLHPQAAYLSNYVRRVPRLPELAVLDRFARKRPELQREIWFGGGSNAYVYGSRRSLSSRIFPSPVEGEPLYRASGVQPVDPGTPDGDQARRLRRSLERVRRADGGQVLVIKRIANNRRVPLLHLAFPDARFVRLVRDGRAVALSLSKVDWWLDDEVWWYGGTPRRWQAEGGDPWEICARNWVEELDALDRGLAAIPSSQIMDLRYEDFVAAADETLQAVAAFGGLPASTAWDEGRAHLAFPNRNEHWRRDLPPDALETIMRIQSPRLESLGYVASDRR